MKRTIILLILIQISFVTLAQVKRPEVNQNKIKLQKAVNRIADSLQKKMSNTDLLVAKTHYTDYKKYDIHRDSSIIDTTLTIFKDYQFNYLRKDDFELLAFSNQGQTFNKLAYQFEQYNANPSIGAKAKHFNYKEIEHIYYYKVPTPTTELMYRTGMEQGQVLDAMLTMNTSPQFNFSIGYKGLRSLGTYRNSLSSHGNFTATFNYLNKKKNYDIRGHYTSQDLMNQENGGLTDLSLSQFLSNDANYKQRGRLDVNLLTAESELKGKRYFVEQRFRLLRIKSDSLQKYQITLGQKYSYETKHFEYTQADVSTLFGTAFTSKIDDHAYHQQHNASAYVNFKYPLLLGNFRVTANYHRFIYGFKNPAENISLMLPSELKDTKISGIIEWNASIKKIHLKAILHQQISGEKLTKSLLATAIYKKDSVNWVKGFLNLYTKAPDLNYQLYRSNYKKYNWHTNFSNEEFWNLGVELKSNQWIHAQLSYHKINNWLFLDANNEGPKQTHETINYLKATVNKGFTYRKFGLENTLMYQKATENAGFSVPQIVSRNTLYYATNLFKGNPIYIQTGVTVKYFSSFFAPNYNPLLGEFTPQTTVKIGDFPTLDVFLNGRIQRTRLFLKVENVTSKIKSPDYFSAPNYPSRDFTVRFGLVWNFFI